MTTLRVFLSSTFKDMGAERDFLVREVFPKLRDWAEGIGVHLVEVDLRWGLPKEFSDEHKIMHACLDEVDLCRPLFVCFLGHSYGSLVKAEDLTESVLKSFHWIDEKEHIGRSYTEMEIIHAVLRKDAPAMESLFYFRSRELSDDTAREQKLPAEDAASAAKLEALKAQIRAAHPSVHGDYPSEAKLGEWIAEDLKPLIARRAVIAGRPGLAWMQRRGRLWAGQMQWMQQVSTAVIKHFEPGMLARLGLRAAPQGLVITGAPGCGKSTLLAAWASALSGLRARTINPQAKDGDVQRALRETDSLWLAEEARPQPLDELKRVNPALLCLSADECGAANEDAGDADAGWPLLARRLMEFIRDRWARDLVVPSEREPARLLYALPRALECVPKAARLILALDGVDLLRDRSRRDALAWLPAHLPAQVFVVCTAAESAPDLAAQRGWGLVELPARLPDRDLDALTRARFLEHGKRFGAEDARTMSELLCQVPARWTGLVLADLRAIGNFKALPARTAMLREVAKDAGALGALLLEAMIERHGGALVEDAIGLLMLAREGLLEMELRELLSRKAKEPLPSAEWSPVHLGLRDWLMPTSGALVPGPELRLAWEACCTSLDPQEAHARRETRWKRLVDYFFKLGATNHRALEQMPWLYRDRRALKQLLSTHGWLGALWQDRQHEVRALWRRMAPEFLPAVMQQWAGKSAGDALGWCALASLALAEGTDLEAALVAARRGGALGCEEAMLTEAALLRRLNRGAEAVVLLRDFCVRAFDESLIARARLLLAELLDEAAPSDEARELASHALAIARRHNDPGLLIAALGFLGRKILEGACPADALPFFTELERVAGLAGNERAIIQALHGRGVALRFSKQPRAEARQALEKALRLAEETTERALEHAILGSLVDLLQQPSERTEAEAYLERRLRRAREADDAFSLAADTARLARIQRDQGRREDAVTLYRSAQSQARKLGARKLEEECAKELWSLGIG